MRNTTLLDINKFTPYTVGFDKIINQMSTYLDNQAASSGYPPYNITQSNNSYTIEIALAGVSKNDIIIESEQGVLTVSYTPNVEKNAEENFETSWLYKGIALRGFSRKFTIADDIKIVGAEMDNGLLTISLERKVPETKKPKRILID